MDSFNDRMRQRRKDKTVRQQQTNDVGNQIEGSDKVQKAVIDSTKAHLEAMQSGDHQVQVPELQGVVDALNKQTLSMLVLHDPKLQEAAQNLKAVVDEISNTASKFKNLNDLSSVLQQLLEEMKALPDKVAATDKSGDLVPHIQNVAKAVKGQAAPVVNAPAVDLSPVVKKLDALAKSMPSAPKALNLSPLIDAVNTVSEAVHNQQFPVANFELPFKIKNTTGNSTDKTNYTSTQASVVTSSDDATLTGIVALNPDGTKISGSGGGGAQYTDGSATVTHPIGTIPVYDNAGTITAVSATNRLPVSATGTVTANAGTNLNTSLLALETGGNLATVVTNTAPLTLAQGSTTSGQLGNLIMGAVTTAAPTYTTAKTNPLSLTTTGLLRVDGSGVTQPVSLTSTTITGTVSVTQSGTWNVGLSAGSNLVGKVGIDQTTVGTTNAVSVAQIGANTVLTGNGVTGTGSQRVTIASDNTAFAVNATLSAETTKVIGVVRTADGSGNLLTSTGNALDVNLKTSAASNISTNEAQINGVTPLMGNGVTGTGSQRVTIASDNTAFSVNAVQSGTWTVQPGNTANTTPWLVSTRPGTSGGFTTFHLASAGSTNATNIKASAGQVFGWYIYNSNAAARKLVFHNTAGTPTAGASVFFSIVIPPTSAANVFTETGIAFGTGVAITMVTGLADSDATAVAANDLIVNIFYA